MEFNSTLLLLPFLSLNMQLYPNHRCTSDRSCQRGYICHTDGICQYPCSDNSDCLSTEYCQSEGKICQTKCSSSEGCTVGFTCIASEGTCHKSCKEQKDCKRNQHCNT